jgi:hypothetical protein
MMRISVTPAKAGVSCRKGTLHDAEIPAFAGMTGEVRA